jgi:predicted small lipoprotein YifL
LIRIISLIFTLFIAACGSSGPVNKTISKKNKPSRVIARDIEKQQKRASIAIKRELKRQQRKRR